MQCYQRSDVKYHDPDLINGHGGIVDGVKCFDGHLEPTAVQPVKPVVGNGKGGKPDDQYSVVNYSADDQKMQ